MKRQLSNKILRHQVAKEKYREFESNRARQKPQSDNLRIPQPGQFFVQPSKPSKLSLDPIEISQPQFKRPASSKCYTSHHNKFPIEKEDGDQQNCALGITKSIKVIVNRQNTRLLSPTSKVIPELINKRMTKTKTQEKVHTPTNIRPVSAQLFTKLEKLDLDSIDNCELLHKAYDFDRKLTESNERKPTSFLVKQRKKTVRHIQGYHTITLNREDIDGQVFDGAQKSTQNKISPYLTTFEMPKQKRKIEYAIVSPNFLPLEYYMLDDLSPEQLTKLYGNKTGPTVGFSKWFDNTGQFEWRKCEIKGYDAQSQRWSINWPNGQSKFVSRSNLRFQKQNESLFMKNLAEAENYRNLSEIYYKYNYMIDLMQSPTSSLPVRSKDRIIKMIQGFAFRIGKTRNPIEFSRLTFEEQFIRGSHALTELPLESTYKPSIMYKSEDLNGTMKEVQKLYVRTNHQIEFDSTLPFSEERKIIFYGHLPNHFFESVLETAAPETTKRGCITIVQNRERAFPFLSTFAKIQQIAHIANPKRLNVMQMLRSRQLEMEKMVCWADISKPCTIQEFDVMWSEKLDNILHQLSIKSCDTQHEIGNELDHFYLEKRSTIDEQSKKLLNHASKFQFLANHRFELLARNIFERTLTLITAKLNNSLIPLTKNKAVTELTHKDIIQYHRQVDFVATSPSELLIQVDYKYENNQLVFQPSSEQILHLFESKQLDLTAKMASVRSIDKCYLDPARADRRMKIFESNDQGLKKLQEHYRQAVNAVLSVEKIFREQVSLKGKEIMEYNMDAKKRLLKKGNYDEFQVELKVLQQYLVDIEELMLPRKMRLGIFYIDCSELRNKLRQKVYDISGEVYKLLIDRIKRDNEKLSKSIDAIIDKLRAQPTDLQGMTQQLIYAESKVNMQLETVYLKINEVMQKMDLLSAMNYRMDYEDFQKSWQIYSKPLSVKHRQQKCIRAIEGHYRKLFSDDLTKSRDELTGETQEIGWKFEKYTIYCKITEVDIASLKMARLCERIEKAQKKAELINSRQVLLKWKPTDFSELTETKVVFMPYYKVWTLAKNFNCTIPTLLSGPFNTIDKKIVTEEVEGAYEELCGLEKNEFKNNSKILRLTQQVRQLYSDFRQYLPLINGLRNADLRERHWEKVCQATGVVNLNESFDGNLQSLLDAGIMKQLIDVVEISEIASKQLAYERLLNKLKKDWREVKLNILASEQIPTVEELELLLERIDNDMVRVQAIIGSPFVKFLENEVVMWRNTFLYKAHEVFDLLNRTQQLWMSLYPIFLNKNIEKQLPQEYAKYLNFDKMWKALVQQLIWQPMVIQLIQTRIKENLMFMMEMLEQISKGLLGLFDLKRSIFARFYFLSNQEMLSIYSKTQSVDHFRVSARLCFDSVQDLQINPEGETQAIICGRESVKLCQRVKLLQGTPLEEQFMHIEKVISDSLKEHLQNIFKSGKAGQIKQLAHLSQAIQWTDSTAKAILESSLDGLLQVYYAKLEDLKQQLRVGNQEYTSTLCHQSVLSMLVLQHIYQRDVLQSLHTQQINELTNFAWTVQLRNYYNKGGDYTVSILNLNRKYGFEYLGLKDRICVTPTTEKCFRSLFHSLDTAQIGCIQGQVDSGKTQILAQMAYTVGKRFIVLTCCSITERSVLTKVFQGMCTSGAWVCFEHFDQMNIEVLSVMAQLVKSVQQVQIASSRNLFSGVNTFGRLKSAVIEEKICPVDISYGLLLTSLNARQQTLPDTLRTVIRPVGIVTPHIDIILSSLLSSYGFNNSNDIAVKIVSVFRDCQQLIVSLSHYSFGLRTAISVINIARLNKHSNEYHCVYEALISTISPFLKESDALQFNVLLSDYFPNDDSRSNPTIEEESSCVAEFYQKDGYEITTVIENEAKQLEDTIKTYPATIVCGECMTGKSTMIQKVSEINRANLVKLMPKATPMEVMFGRVDEDSSFQPGILSKYLKYSDVDSRTWISFDGGIDSIWIENLNPVLSFNCPLTLASGEKLTLHTNTRLIFETDSLSHASPNFVARCGKIYLQNRIPSEHILNWWFAKLPECLMTEAPFYRELVKHLLDPMTQFVNVTINAVSESLMINLSQSAMMASFLRIFQSLRLGTRTKLEMEAIVIKNNSCLSGALTQTAKPCNSSLSDAVQSEIFGIFVFSVVWSFGSVLNYHARKAFSKEFKHLCKRTVQLYMRNIGKHALPSDELSLFEAMFDGKEWMLWTTKEQQMNGSPDTNPDYLVFTTAENIKNSYLLNLLVGRGHSMLLVGQASSGKNTSIEYFFSNLNKQKYLKTSCSFSQQITLEDTIGIFQRRIEKQRRSKNSVGPALGKVSIIYINDISMAASDRSNSQSSLQLMRQWFTSGGWHDNNGFKRVEDISFCSSCSQAEKIPARLMRYLNPVWSSDEEDWPKPALKKYLTNCLGTPAYIDSLLKISFNLQKILVREFKPRPGQQHIRFGFKDTLQILMNISSLQPSYLNQGDMKMKLLKAWIYECRSSYFDRMTEETHHTKLYYSMNNVLLEQFGIRYKQVQGNDQTNRMFSLLNPNKNYVETSVSDVKSYLESLTLSCPTNHVVFYSQVVKLVSKLTRSINRVNGYALCIASRGLAVREICRLAAYTLQYNIVAFVSDKYEEWKDILRKVIRQTNTKECVLYVEADETSELILSEINSFMKIGCFSSTFNVEEIDVILSDLRPNTPPAQLLDYWNDQMTICRKNLRIVVLIDPASTHYRQHVRNYSGFFDRASVIYTQPMTSEAISEITHMQQIDREIVNVFESVGILVDRELSNKIGRVMPCQIESLIKTFNRISHQRRDTLLKRKHQYQQAIQKLNNVPRDIIELESQVILFRNCEEEVTGKIMAVTSTIETKTAKKNIVESTFKQKEMQLRRDEQIAVDLKGEFDSRMADDTSKVAMFKEELKGVEAKDLINLLKLVKIPSSGVRLTLELLFVLTEKKRKEKDEQPWKQMLKQLSEPNSKAMKKLMQLQPIAVPQKIHEKMKAIVDKNHRDVNIGDRQPRVLRILSQLCLSVIKFCQNFKNNQPLRFKLAEANRLIETSKIECSEAQLTLNQLTDTIQEDQSKLNALTQDCIQIHEQLITAQAQIDNVRLVEEMFCNDIDGWKTLLKTTEKKLEELTGDCVIAATTIIFLSNIAYEQREAFRNNHLKPSIQQMGITIGDSFIMAQVSDSTKWIDGQLFRDLPNDSAGHQNAAIYHHSQRVVFVHDPHQQLIRWLSSITDPQQFTIVRNELELLNKDTMQGTLIIIENEQKLNIAYQQFFGEEKSQQLQKIVIVSQDRLEIGFQTQMKSTQLNFTCGNQSLKDFFTQCIVREEEPNNEEQIKRVLSDTHEMRVRQLQLCDSVMDVIERVRSLSSLCQNKDVYEKFKTDKHQITELSIRLKEGRYAEERVLKVRHFYENAGKFAADLYVRMQQIGSLCPTYHINLNFFTKVLVKPIKEMQKQPQKNHRIRALQIEKNMRRSLYTMLPIALRQSDMIIWNSIFVMVVLQTDKKLDKQLWTELLKTHPPYNTLITSQFVPTIEGFNLLRIFDLQFKALKGLPTDIKQNPTKWSEYFSELNKGLQSLPQQYPEAGDLYTLLLIKIFKPYEFPSSLCSLAERLSEPNTSILDQYTRMILVSSAYNPCIIYQGDSVLDEFVRLGQEMSIDLNILTVTMHTEAKVQERLQLSCQIGSWLILQNCENNMKILKLIEQTLNEGESRSRKIHPDFRVILLVRQTDPKKYLLTGPLLHRSIKIRIKQSLIQNVLTCYRRRFSQKSDKKFYNSSSTHQAEWKRMFFSLSFMHAIVRSRLYSRSGWSGPFNFQPQDLDSSFRWIRVGLDDSDELCFESIRTCLEQCVYGSRVVMEDDYETMCGLINRFVKQEVINEQHHVFATSKLCLRFGAKVLDTVENTIDYISKMPIDEVQMMEIGRCAIARQSLEQTQYLLNNQQQTNQLQLQKINSRILDVAYLRSILGNADINLTALNQVFPIKSDIPLNTFITAQTTKFRILLLQICESLSAVEQYLNCNRAEPAQFMALSEGRVPTEWLSKSYPSTKPLLAYLINLREKLNHLQLFTTGTIVAYNPGHLFNPVGLITCLKQDFCRKNVVDLEDIQLQTIVTSTYGTEDLKPIPINDGMYLTGIYLQEGDWHDNIIRERSSNTFEGIPLPIIHFKIQIKSDNTSDQIIQKLPLYREAISLQSTNQIMKIHINSSLSQRTIIMSKVRLTCEP